MPGSFGFVAFDRNIGGSDRDVFVFDSGTQTVTNLTQNPATDVKPAFSPDGQWVVFASNRTGGWELYRTRVDGSGSLQKLTPGTQGDGTGITGIDWSPNGSTIIFSTRISSVWRLFEIPSSGGTPTQLLGTTFGGATKDVQYAQYSRDGSMIYHHRTTPFNAFDSDIFSVNADGSNEVKLTNLTGRGAGFPTEILVNGVAKVVYTEWNPAVSNSSHQVIMNTDGSNPIPITTEDAISEHEAVGPGGNVPASLEDRIIFTRAGSGVGPDLVMLASDGTVLINPVVANASSADWWIP